MDRLLASSVQNLSFGAIKKAHFSKMRAQRETLH
jgi:hypothetical protein